MMATMSATAQHRYEDNNHEVALSYGVLSNSQWLDFALMVVTSYVEGYEPVKVSAVGPISAEYFYHATDWLGVGGIFTFGQMNTNYNDAIDEVPVYTGKSTNFTLMPAVKFNWFRRQHFGMYSKVGAGVLMCNMKAIPVDPVEKPVTKTGFAFNWQVSALGLEFGGTQFRGFVEGGIGEQGIVLAGLRYMF